MAPPNGRASMPNYGAASGTPSLGPHKQIVLILVSVFIVALAAGTYFFFRSSSPTQVSRAFFGTIERTEGNVVIARGTFITDGVPLARNQEKGDEVRITVSSSTALTHIAWQLPDPPVGATSSFAWSSADIKKEKGEGSLTELAGIENVPFSATSDENILYKNQFEAKTLEYLTTSFSKRPDKIPPP